jgi:sialic acid synthase SpsE
MIESAALKGADTIEFQLAYTDDFYFTSDPNYEVYKSRESDDTQLMTLINTSHILELDIVAAY